MRRCRWTVAAAWLCLCLHPAATWGDLASEIAESDRDLEREIVPLRTTGDEGQGADLPDQIQAPAEARTIVIAPSAERALPRTAQASQQDDETPPVVDLSAEEVGLSDILGLPVRSADGTEVGEVENVTISLATGRVVTLVIASGGLLGLGGETRRVPMADVSIDPLGDAVILSEDADGG